MRSPGGRGAAGFWVRALALALDLALLWVVHGTLRMAAQIGPGSGLGARTLAAAGALGFWVTYRTMLHAHGGQTLGKLVAGIRVVPEGPGVSAISGSVAWLRCLAEGCSLLPAGGGYLMAAWRADKRALHDLAAGTRVVRVRTPGLGAVDARPSAREPRGPIGPESERPPARGGAGGWSGFD